MKRLLLAALLLPSLLFGQVPEYDGEVKCVQLGICITSATSSPAVVYATSVDDPEYRNIEVPACQMNGVRGYCILNFRGIRKEAGQLTDGPYEWYVLEFYQAEPLFDEEVTYVWDVDETGSPLEITIYNYANGFAARCKSMFARVGLGLAFAKYDSEECDDTIEIPVKPPSSDSDSIPFAPIFTGSNPDSDTNQ